MVVVVVVVVVVVQCAAIKQELRLGGEGEVVGVV